jgi:hypothetical protein
MQYILCKYARIALLDSIAQPAWRLAIVVNDLNSSFFNNNGVRKMHGYYYFLNIKISQLYSGVLNDYFFQQRNRVEVARLTRVLLWPGLLHLRRMCHSYFLKHSKFLLVCFIKKKICLSLYSGLSERTRSVLSVDRTTVVNILNRCYSSRHSNNALENTVDETTIHNHNKCSAYLILLLLIRCSNGATTLTFTRRARKKKSYKFSQ